MYRNFVDLSAIAHDSYDDWWWHDNLIGITTFWTPVLRYTSYSVLLLLVTVLVLPTNTLVLYQNNYTIMGDPVSYAQRYTDRHDRATSAGYRFPVSSQSRVSSAYHEKCIPAKQRRDIHSAPPDASRKHTRVDFRKCDAVTGDRIWRESVGREHGAVKKW